MLRPLPVDCWDWTRGHRASASALRSQRDTVPPGQNGLGRDALGLSHLTYDASGTINLHQLDQPPFPCKEKVAQPEPRVKRHSLPTPDERVPQVPILGPER